MIEIGPGLGALTKEILPRVKTLEAIEIDRDLIGPLKIACEALGSLTVHSNDVLQVDFSLFTQKRHTLRVIGNLPYQITTPLLFHLVQYKHWMADLHFMLQQEVVARMSASPGTKVYGRLSVMIQYHFEVIPLECIPRTVFYPVPSVDSQIVRLIPRETPIKATKLSLIVRDAFNHRRKTLQNSLREWIDPNTLMGLGISPTARPEQLSVEEFVKLSVAARDREQAC